MGSTMPWHHAGNARAARRAGTKYVRSENPSDRTGGPAPKDQKPTGDNEPNHRETGPADDRAVPRVRRRRPDPWLQS
jgi:hypothetical protein